MAEKKFVVMGATGHTGSCAVEHLQKMTSTTGKEIKNEN